MIKEIELNTLYLYHGGYDFEVVAVEKINEKSVRLSRGSVRKEDFMNNATKLTEEEIRNYKGELVKRLSQSEHQLIRLKNVLENISNTLKLDEFVEINKDKLQQLIELTTDVLKEDLAGVINIAGKKFIFNKFNQRLKEIQEK